MYGHTNCGVQEGCATADQNLVSYNNFIVRIYSHLSSMCEVLCIHNHIKTSHLIMYIALLIGGIYRYESGVSVCVFSVYSIIMIVQYVSISCAHTHTTLYQYCKITCSHTIQRELECVYIRFYLQCTYIHITCILLHISCVCFHLLCVSVLG